MGMPPTRNVAATRKPGEQPAGWMNLGGRADTYHGSQLSGMKAYAPQGYAEVYNNFVSQRPQGAKGDLLNAFQRLPCSRSDYSGRAIFAGLPCVNILAAWSCSLSRMP